MIPKELMENALWCVWKREDRGGRPTKIPYDPKTGKRAESNHPETFGDYELAYERYLTEDYDGVGILLSNGYSAIDIDHCCEDGVISDFAQSVVATMKSYAEYSPSKTGLRIIFKAERLQYDTEKYYIKNPQNGMEIYVCGVTNRFVTMTGNTAYGYPLREASEELQEVLDAHMVRPVTQKAQTAVVSERVDLADDEIISKASRNDKFRALFYGDLSDYNNDHSSADLALCNMLAFWTGRDEGQMDRIFRRSALYREKWNRDDYRGQTIRKAIDACTEIYNPVKAHGIWEKLELQPKQLGNWEMDSSGISCYVPPKKKDDEPTLEHVTSTPLFPEAYFENLTEGIHKVKLKFLRNGVLSTVICDMETVANKSKIVSLANAGINVTSNNASKLVQYLADMERYNGNIIPHYRSVSHVGWTGRDFLPYSDGIKFDGEGENRTLYGAITQTGDFDAWVQYTKELRKNPYLRLMMAASFASPLIEKCNALPFVFHLWGSTGKGKTVALMVAMSIWGDPSAGKLTRTMNMTNAAMMSTVAFLRNLPFGGDELQTIKTIDMKYDQLIMQITEGIERGRMHYNKNLPTRSWRCAFLFTGEERCTNDYSGGGTKNRVIEIEAEGEIVANGNQTVGFIARNYGYAGKRFIQYIASKDCSADYSELFDRVINECNTTAKQAAAATMLLLGDKLACECIYQDETPLDVSDIAPFLKSDEEVDTATRAYNYLIDWIAVNDSKFRSSDYGECWGMVQRQTAFVIDSVLSKALQEKGFSFDAVKKAWAENGWLIKYQNKFKKRKVIFGSKPYCVEICLPESEEVDQR